ncbi:MAG: flagellar protein FlgN [Paenibacillus sp.]|uniref:Flagellar protein FlgN n=1 Tax=Paenibacillus timonensis TaxID=225915 RepID=A0ABW3SC15_9BACL|nr:MULTISPECIES: flagellar protein FlgN [Paenibacillus]MCH1640514.1 flagellar protein FlgN [Paenibacillus timonensis]MDU2242276.1 flagellar protein FlgN [Paenibacillus sp.]MDU4695607.1 flagellar protein FlgN [Paenibacillus sp.]
MSIQPLIESMNQMDQLHTELLQVMGLKKQAILGRNYEEMVRILSRESKLVRAIEEQEMQLLSAAQTFLHSKGIKSQLELTVSEILRLVFDPEEKRMLDEARQKLSDRLIESKRANSLNQQLIQQSLSFIDFSLNLMIGGEDEGTTYSPPTVQDKRASARSMFDTKA